MRVHVRVGHPEHRERIRDVADALVDPGATWSIIPEGIASELGLPVIDNLTVQTAAGPQELSQSYAYIELEGDKRLVTNVLISPTLAIVLIGVTTLESLGLAVDPASGQLRPSEVFLL